MINVTQLRQGIAFLLDNVPHRVLSYTHTHTGRGGGTVRVKIKNLRTGSIVEKTFKNNDRVEDIDITKRQLQYLYTDADDLIFMDDQTYEQIPVSRSVAGDAAQYLKEGETVWLLIWSHDDKDEVMDIDLPPTVIFEVAEADPSEKGNSATNVFKDGILENGMKVRIPLFVSAGDKIKISTQDGSYQSRA